MVIIDSDVLLLAYAFSNDIRKETNQLFLETIRTAQPATTIYNVMEVLGQLSFNLAPEKLLQWQSWLVEAHNLIVIWGINPDVSLLPGTWRDEIYERPFEKMLASRMSYMDAMILSLAERTPDVEAVVTWNAKHFKGKSSLKVMTPGEYLQNQTS